MSDCTPFEAFGLWWLRFGISMGAWIIIMLLQMVWNKGKSEVLSEPYKHIWPVRFFMNYWGWKSAVESHFALILGYGAIFGFMVGFWKIFLVLWGLLGLYKGVVYLCRRKYEETLKGKKNE